MSLNLLVIIAVIVNILALSFIYSLACRYRYLDNMTHIYNKQYLVKIINKWRAQKKDFTVCFFDIDKFKMLNDTYGHLAGDKGIIHLANTLQSNFKNKGIAARIGGDEFAVAFLGHLKNEEQNILENLKNHHYEHNGKHISFTVSVGICRSNPSLSCDDLMESSDKMLYKNKNDKTLNILYPFTSQ